MSKCIMLKTSVSASCECKAAGHWLYLRFHYSNVAVPAVRPMMMFAAAVQSTSLPPPYASSHTCTKYCSMHCNMYESTQCVHQRYTRCMLSHRKLATLGRRNTVWCNQVKKWMVRIRELIQLKLVVQAQASKSSWVDASVSSQNPVGRRIQGGQCRWWGCTGVHYNAATHHVSFAGGKKTLLM